MVQEVVAAFHFAHCPRQRIGGLLRIGDDGGQQVGHSLVLTHLDPLGIDEDHAHLVWGGAHQDRGDDGVEARRFARPRRAGDQDVGHGRQIDQHCAAVDVTPYRDLERMLRVARFGRREDVAQSHDLAIGIGYFDTDRLLARDGSEDAHVGRRHGIGDVAIETGHPRHFDARTEFEFVAGHGGADDHVHEPRLYAVFGQRSFELMTALANSSSVDLSGRGSLEQSHRRQLPRRGGERGP